MDEHNTVVSAVGAAKLIGKTPQTIYAWIDSGKLPARKQQLAGDPATWMIRIADLVAIPGVKVNQDQLTRLTLADAEGRLERWMLAMEARQDTIEKEFREFRAQVQSGVLPVAALDAPGVLDAYSVPPTPIALPVGYFRNKAQRGRFLELHGWPKNTTRHWDACPMGPIDNVLSWALAHDNQAGYRAGERTITQCSDDACPCHTLMRGE